MTLKAICKKPYYFIDTNEEVEVLRYDPNAGYIIIDYKSVPKNFRVQYQLDLDTFHKHFTVLVGKFK